MSDDSFTEVTSSSWLERMGGAVVGGILSPVLVLLGVVLVFIIEWDAADNRRALADGVRDVISVGSVRVNPENEGQLVYLSAMATPVSSVRDSVFELDLKVLRLKRSVEMFQWVEHSESETTKKIGGEIETATTYTYKKEWSEESENSNLFKVTQGHVNPKVMQYKSEVRTSQAVHVGPFLLGAGLVKQMKDFTPYRVNFIPSALKSAVISGDGVIYIKSCAGSSPESPMIGDLRVSFSVVKPGVISVVGRQHGAVLVPYKCENGPEIALIGRGQIPAGLLFEKAQADNRHGLWIMRGLLVLMIAVGIFLGFKPVCVFLDIIPCLGDLGEVAFGFIAIVIGGVIGSVAVAISWLYFYIKI
ncbi:TMEM43 family protein [Maridesulfovibrio sp.]|uniref:TMEM43 family protein n=1 Tax=Maridesulfovibrio sp. TaxID=2795000 RepID=UPI002A18CDBD|nr:TMEM43 family protein [Maridesulfovibrio sp.]